MNKKLTIRLSSKSGLKWRNLSPDSQLELVDSVVTSDKVLEQFDTNYLEADKLLTESNVLLLTDSDLESLRSKLKVAPSTYLSRVIDGMLSKSRALNEVALVARWAKLNIKEFYVLEHRCSCGRIDIWIPGRGEVIEGKIAADWKHALGQVLSYKIALGKACKSTKLLLIGDRYSHDHQLIELICSHYDVNIIWYEKYC